MKERPIIFSAPMVMAILDGRKTQTRRIVKTQPNHHHWEVFKNNSMADYKLESDVKDGFVTFSHWMKSDHKGIDWRSDGFQTVKCKQGKPGDRLCVRETWADVNSECGPAILYRADSTMQNWRDFCKEFGPDYGAGPSMNYEKYPGDYVMWCTDLLNRDNHKEDGYVWKSPIHMPRWASRITLEITSLRVERVQDISCDDANAEGVQAWVESFANKEIYHENGN
ncbi:MAG: hypothetical protein H6937_07245, partial [Burkholderiales bacterium]|nr:hypothetical protein [Burkholderiales bacterium]